MNYKKNILILSIFIVVSIQILLLLNNRQKSTFKYFIWNTQDVSIGRLICISFISGIIISSIFNKTLNSNVRTVLIKDDNETSEKKDYSINEGFNNDSSSMPPERDVRDTQPTISVNYRVIKNNGSSEIKDREESSDYYRLEEDWYDDNPEW